MSYKIKLTIDGEERYVRTYHADYFLPNSIDKMLVSPSSARGNAGNRNEGFNAWKYSLLKGYDRTLPWYSKPNGKSVLGGLFPLTLESTSNDDVFYFWLKDQSMLNGSLEFFRAKEGEEDVSFSRIDFWDAYLVEIEEYASKGSDAMWMQLLISPGIIRYNKETVHKKPWHVTDINKKEPTLVETEEEKEPQVTKVYWKDADGERSINEIPIDRIVTLYIESKNIYEGEPIEINFIKEDGSLIDGKKEFTISTIAGKNGITEIKNFEIKRDWEIDEQY